MSNHNNTSYKAKSSSIPKYGIEDPIFAPKLSTLEKIKRDVDKGYRNFFSLPYRKGTVYDADGPVSAKEHHNRYVRLALAKKLAKQRQLEDDEIFSNDNEGLI